MVAGVERGIGLTAPRAGLFGRLALLGSGEDAAHRDTGGEEGRVVRAPIEVGALRRNANGRQAVFDRSPRQRRYRATFIDQGFCFHAGDWSFADSPLRGVYLRNAVYAGVTGWQSFEPWLTRIEEMPPETVGRIAELVPPEWYSHDTPALEQLLDRLLARRGRVRELIAAFRDSDRRPFPLWDKDARIAVPQQFHAAPTTKFVM